jgi:hypothetical protein
MTGLLVSVSIGVFGESEWEEEEEKFEVETRKQRRIKRGME